MTPPATATPAEAARKPCPFRVALALLAAIFPCAAAFGCPSRACAQLVDPTSMVRSAHTVPSPREVAASALDGATVSDQPGATGDGPAPGLRRPRLVWRDEWRRLEPGEVLFSGITTAAAVGFYLSPPSAESARWYGGIGLDDAARDGLHLRDLGARETAASVSDGLLLALMAMPVADALIGAWAAGGSSDVAAQMLTIDWSAHALSQALTGLVKFAVRRERPLAAACRLDPAIAATDPRCGESQIEPASFFSGHTSAAFTSAALVCLHHTELGLMGDEGGDAAACVTALGLASSVGVLRMMADRHYLSDVAVGAAVGMLSGWLFPYLLRYAVFSAPDIDLTATVAPDFSQDRVGLQVFGAF